MSQHDELEVKARVDDAEALSRTLATAGVLEFRGTMKDCRYDRAGAFEARDEVVRLRVYQPAGKEPSWGVLGWKGPAGARGAYRHRAEVETRVEDPDSAASVLERLGLEVILRIDRDIEQYRVGEAIVRLERYPGMDVLLEVEGPPAAIEQAIAATGLPRRAFLAESLPHFVAAYELRTGRRARLATSDPS